LYDGDNVDTRKPVPADPTNSNNWLPVGTDFSGDITALDGRIDRLEAFETIVDTKLNISDNSALEFDADGGLKVKIAENINGFVNGIEVDSEGLKVASYNLVAKTTDVNEDYAAQYEFKVNGKTVTTINIPKDQVLNNAEILTVTEENLPYTGAKVGDKYIKFIFQNNNTPQYLAVQDLVDVYVGSDYITINENNVISLDINKVLSAANTQLNITGVKASIGDIENVLNGFGENDGLVADVAGLKTSVGTIGENVANLTTEVNNHITKAASLFSEVSDDIQDLNAKIESHKVFDVDTTVTCGVGLSLVAAEEGEDATLVKVNVDLDKLAAAVIAKHEVPAPIAENIAVSAFGTTYTEDTNVQAVLESLDSRIRAAVSGGVTSVVSGFGINVNAGDANNPTVSVKTSDLVVTGSALTVNSDNKIDIVWSEL
jgi:hypothetical protein